MLGLAVGNKFNEMIKIERELLSYCTTFPNSFNIKPEVSVKFHTNTCFRVFNRHLLYYCTTSIAYQQQPCPQRVDLTPAHSVPSSRLPELSP